MSRSEEHLILKDLFLLLLTILITLSLLLENMMQETWWSNRLQAFGQPTAQPTGPTSVDHNTLYGKYQNLLIPKIL